MSEPRTLRRRRRPTDTVGTSVPKDVAEWFAAGFPAPEPWTVLLPPTQDRLPEWWRAWSAENPGGKPMPPHVAVWTGVAP
jgi:hypothetical protein